MDANKEIKKVFELFTENKFDEAQELNNQILEYFPSHMYAKRYQKILADKIAFDNKSSQKIDKTTKVRGKSLKCPHCLAKIPFSGLNGEQREKIKKGNYSNLEIKCPYCHTKFVLQKRKAESILGLKIGQLVVIEGQKYRITGYVKYKGRWYEGRYSGVTDYLEWILLGENNNYYYFSEGYSIDDGEREYEFELSKKVIPNFSIPSNFEESTKVTVKSIYGENSKNYTIGEKTELYEFTNSGKKYVKEIEGVGSQKEAGIYETKNLSWKEAADLFGIEKSYTNKKSSSNNIGFFISGFIALLILPALIFEPIFNLILENKTKIEISKIDNASKLELNFKDSTIMQERKTSSTKYDYGGVRTYYEKNKGLRFSVKTEEDKKLLEKIIELKNNGENKNFDEEKVIKMFNGDLYKLK